MTSTQIQPTTVLRTTPTGTINWLQPSRSFTILITTNNNDNGSNDNNNKNDKNKNKSNNSNNDNIPSVNLAVNISI